MLWYAVFALYAAALGGWFFHRHFKGVFEAQEKKQIIRLTAKNAAKLIGGLARNPNAISFQEYDVLVNSLSKDGRISSIAYFNRFGEVRWHRDTRLFGLDFEDYGLALGVGTEGIREAILGKKPVIRRVMGGGFREYVIPLAVRGELVGILDMVVSGAAIERRLDLLMFRYFWGALLVVFVLGVGMHIFLVRSVLAPAKKLYDAVEGLSMRPFDASVCEGGGEFGALARAFKGLTERVNAERANRAVRERALGSAERRRWEVILTAVLPPRHFVAVVDENNAVLYTTLPGQRGGDGAAPHLLDVLDGSQQGVLFAAATAFDRPDRIVETTAVLGGTDYAVKAVQLSGDEEIRRTLIVFEPVGEAAALESDPELLSLA
jgi:hypothetical protein